MRTIIYGIGRRFFNLFNDKRMIEDSIRENNIDIIGFSDNNNSLWKKEIVFNERKFYVRKLEEFCKSDFDKILVTSIKNFREIRDDLIQRGYEKESIELLDNFFKTYLDKLYHIENFREKSGIEIGGPSHVFFNIYANCRLCDGINFDTQTVWWEGNDFKYNDVKLGDIFICDATDIHYIKDEKYDFVLSSNVLEHIANPLKALKEFSRIVKPGGVVLTMVPMKEKCFDHNREYTLFSHLLEDYRNDTKEDDLSHLSEIIDKHDYDMDVEGGGRKHFIERAIKNVENRCLHHHVFDEECLYKAYEFAGLKVIGYEEIMGCYMIIGEKSYGECI